MRTFTKWLFFVVIAGLVAVLPLQAQGKSGKEKVAIEHKGKIIYVAPEAVPAHIAHGDPDPFAPPPPPLTFTVALSVIGEADISVPLPQTVDSGTSWTFVVDLPPVPPGASWTISTIETGYEGDAVVTSSISGLTLTVTVSNVLSDVDIIVAIGLDIEPGGDVG